MTKAKTEHPKLPDIVERLRSSLKYALDNIEGIINETDIPSTAILGNGRALLKEIERSPAPAEQHKGDWNIQGAVERENERTRLSAPAEDMEARKDAAYLERNQVVAALASVFPSGTARTTIPGWSDDWHGCVYIDTPVGQLSWHYHDSHAHLFARLPPYAGQWDGHTTDEKYERLAALSSGRDGRKT